MFFFSQISGLVENFWIYSDAINEINVKVCLMVLLSELYLFIPLSVIFTIFQGYSNVKQVLLRIMCSYPVELKLCGIIK